MNEPLRAFVEAYHHGTAANVHHFLGCHPEQRDGCSGFVFRVWAPNAQSISVVADFNYWNPAALPMKKITHGIWEAWSAHAREGDAYKYFVRHWSGKTVYKADPVGFRTCRVPDTSSMICAPSRYCWNDSRWMEQNTRVPLDQPVNIYEVHLGSWRRKEDGSLYSYSELAPILANYVRSMGYTHVELMPLCESPNDPSLGYQVTGYFAPTSRYGAPDELMELVDTLHQAGIGVILDWMASHFPKDAHGLFEFDGTCTYESPDPDTNEHPQWDTRYFDLGKPEVRSFLISSAMYWLEVFHIDGIRVDAVDTMLYLDCGRRTFKPNRYGGRENLEAREFLRQLNRTCFLSHPAAVMCASVDAPNVTVPDFDGGLGFLFNWHLPWAENTLSALCQGIHLAFPSLPGNCVLSLPHDAVAPGRGSLIAKMPGTYEQKFARLRLLRGLQMTTPGKKLLFMGGEFGQFTQWNPTHRLDWMLLDYEMHQKMQSYTRSLNRFYREHPSLWQNDFHSDGCRWLQTGTVLAFLRADLQGNHLLVACNLGEDMQDLPISLPGTGTYRSVFCSEELRFGGCGTIAGPVTADPAREAILSLPPLSVAIFAKEPF